jgi:hypothetical protein
MLRGGPNCFQVWAHIERLCKAHMRCGEQVVGLRPPSSLGGGLTIPQI